MKLFWCPQTRAVRALWMLEELGRPFERVMIDIRDEDRAPNPEFDAASPMGKVPAIQDGEVAIAESAAICLYVADRYSSGDLAPALDDPARGRFLYWMFYTPAVVEPAMGEKFSGAQPNKLSHGWGDWDTMLSTLEQGLDDGPWLLGDHFTAADVMVGSSVEFMRQFDILPSSPNLEAYADRCTERPAYARARDAEGG